MKSIKTQYIDLMEGRMSQYNFMRSLRMSLPQYITNVTSFKDSVKILKNKGILSETVDASEGKIKEAKEIKGSSGKEQYSKFSEAENDNLQELTTGINIEHECFPEKTYEEIEKIVLKNIKKNPNYYTDFKLTGIRDYLPQTMNASTPESHQMKFVKGEDSYIDKARGMKPVKGVEKAKASSNKAHKETNKIVKGVEELTHFAQTVRGLQKFAATGGKMKTIKSLQEAKLNIIGEPNAVVKKAMDYVSSPNANPTLKSLSNKIEFQQNPNNPNEAILRYDYWDILPQEAVEKLALQFNVVADSDEMDDQLPIHYYRLKLKPSANKNLGASLEMGASKAGKMDAFKESLEKIVREVLDETFDGRDNLIDPIAAEENEY
jgi:hypothetical protein